MDRLAIFGGTFDPIHNGHIAIARAASASLNADVVFVPAKSPRWKETEASSVDRLEMVKLALKDDNCASFSIDLYEMNSEAEINYSIDTVKYFKNKYPNRSLYFLIGADQVNAFDKWKDADELSRLATIVYVGRPKHPINDEMVIRFNMKRLPYDKMHDIASTDIRDLKNSDICPSVREYIETHKLYYIKKIATYLNEKRLEHSISVANVAYLIAKENKLENAKKAYIAGLLHDIGKYVDEKTTMEIMSQNYAQYIALPIYVYHQFVGEYLAKKDFNIDDEEILEAIKFHTTGRPHFPEICKIVYCADKIEPTRGFDSTKLIAACVDNYYAGFLEVLKQNMEYFRRKGVKLDELISKDFYTLYCGEEIWKR